MATQAAASTTETNLGFILEQVAKEKGIEKKILVDTIEAAILKAAQSAFGPTRELEARFSDDTGQVDLFQYMTVVESVTESEREISLENVEKHKLDATLDYDHGKLRFHFLIVRRQGLNRPTRIVEKIVSTQDKQSNRSTSENKSNFIRPIFGLKRLKDA